MHSNSTDRTQQSTTIATTPKVDEDSVFLRAPKQFYAVQYVVQSQMRAHIRRVCLLSV